MASHGPSIANTAPMQQHLITACELNECGGAAVVAGLSGHPAFECIHLQSQLP